MANKSANYTAVHRNVWCSFCRKRRMDVSTIVAADDVRICNECIDQCVQIVEEDKRRSAAAKAADAVDPQGGASSE